MGLWADSATKNSDLEDFWETGLIPPQKWTPSLADECLPHRERGSPRLGESRQGHDPPLIIHKLHEWSKKFLWQRVWLYLCTKQVVSVGACAYQFLPYSSSGINLVGRELGRQIAASILSRLTPFLWVWGVRKGVWGKGVSLGWRPKIYMCVSFVFDRILKIAQKSQLLHTWLRSVRLTAAGSVATSIVILWISIRAYALIWPSTDLYLPVRSWRPDGSCDLQGKLFRSGRT